MSPAPSLQARQVIEARAARRQHRAQARTIRHEAESRFVEDLAGSAAGPAGLPAHLLELAHEFPAVAGRLAHARVEWAEAVAALLAEPRVRPLADWQPQGKSARTLFRSLAHHLLARFSVTQPVWNAFLTPEPLRAILVPLATHVAAGGSLAEWLRDHAFPVPLTRRMAHDFLAIRDDVPLLHALRTAQFRGLGASPALVQALLYDPSPVALHQHLGDAAAEQWWAQAVAWLAQQSMLAPAQVAPLCDYFRHVRAEEPSYSLKGRTALSVGRAMQEWHRETALGRGYTGATFFRPSGFSGAVYDFSRDTAAPGFRIRVWTITEVLNARALRDEGQRQGHCVFSYARMIEQGICSIWTVTLKDDTGHWAMLTVEVLNATRAIVQVRGRFNRMPTVAEHEILLRWATEARLSLSGGV